MDSAHFGTCLFTEPSLKADIQIRDCDNGYLFYVFNLKHFNWCLNFAKIGSARIHDTTFSFVCDFTVQLMSGKFGQHPHERTPETVRISCLFCIVTSVCLFSHTTKRTKKISIFLGTKRSVDHFHMKYKV